MTNTTNNQAIELLPCPLCGGEIHKPIAKRWTNCLGEVSYSARVGCKSCNLTIETDCGYETEESAENAVIATWNTRVDTEYKSVSATDENIAIELLMREFVAAACECEVRDYLISEYAERIEQAIAVELGSRTCTIEFSDDGIVESYDGELYSYSHPYHELSCGHVVYGIDIPKYCSECGAKVIDG